MKINGLPRSPIFKFLSDFWEGLLSILKVLIDHPITAAAAAMLLVVPEYEESTAVGPNPREKSGASVFYPSSNYFQIFSPLLCSEKEK